MLWLQHMGRHFPLPLLTPYAICTLWQSPHQCGVCIGLYTPSSRQGFCIGCCIAKGVSERCIVRLLLTLLFKNYLTVQVGTLQRIHRQYIRYESVLDDTLIGIENLNSGYLSHQILDPQVLTKYLEIIEDDLEDTAPEYEPVFTSV